MAPTLEWTGYRHWAAGPEATSRAVLHFRNGLGLVVDVDAENGSYLRGLLERRGKRRFAWFETVDGFLIGADATAIATIDWPPAAAAAPAPSQLDRDHLVMRLGDGRTLQLTQVAADDIDRLRGATICDRGGKPFQLAECAGGRMTSIPVQALMLATMPALWMDMEGS